MTRLMLICFAIDAAAFRAAATPPRYAGAEFYTPLLQTLLIDTLAYDIILIRAAAADAMRHAAEQALCHAVAAYEVC